MWTWFHKLASPPHCYRYATVLHPWFFWLSVILISVGFFGGLYISPSDYQMGDAFRILYAHAASAYMAMSIYVIMAISSAVGMIWRIKLAFAVAAASAPVGASFTALALASGAIWGQPMWGTWWVWDARLTSTLVLLFLYFGYMALRASFEDVTKADRAGGIIAIVGVVNVPIIKFSVDWWNTLHQPATISKLDNPSITVDMLWPLLVVIVGFNLYYLAILCNRLRTQILLRERNAKWLLEQ